MALISKLFKGDRIFERCLVNDGGHITPGSKGFHVAKIQDALMKLDGVFPSRAERDVAFYGPTTAKAVLSYKTKRRIINTSYQHAPDNIVGKMTIKAMDAEMAVYESRQRLVNQEIDD